jgi:hypothetical protein
VSNVKLWKNRYAIRLAMATAATTSACPASAQTFGGASNDVFGTTSCTPLTNITVTIQITEDLIGGQVACPSNTTTPSVSKFAFQLNANSPPSTTAFVWQQYIFGISGDIEGAVNNWTASGLSTNSLVGTPAVPVYSALSQQAVIPAGYTLTYTFLNDGSGNVTGVVYTVDDGTGHGYSQQQVLTDFGATPSELAPIVDLQLDLVGPGDGCSTTFVSGAGTITYSASTLLESFPSIPACANGTTTAESSNSVYASVSSAPSTTFEQAFTIPCPAVGSACLTDADCCSQKCTGGTCTSIPLGAPCPSTNNAGVCGAGNVCLDGVCARSTPPGACGGHPVPTTHCASQWRCCGNTKFPNPWRCGFCQ